MKFTIDGETYELAQSKVTFAEARDIERVSGHSWSAIMRDPALSEDVDVIQAMVWISMRRVRPELSFSDLDDVAIDDIAWDDEQQAEEQPDPTQPEESGESGPVDEPIEDLLTSPGPDSAT